MKLNYYMRGLGIGIVVTALLMGIALSGGKEKMTDEEIRQRENEIADNGNSVEDMPSGNRETENDKETGNEEPVSGEAGDELSPQEGEEDIREAGTGNSQGENEIVNEIITIAINSGDGSRVVANKLQQAGLIEDAAAYDAFLCQNGYDKRLKTGRHDIPAGASDEEIAAVVTQKGY